MSRKISVSAVLLVAGTALPAFGQNGTISGNPAAAPYSNNAGMGTASGTPASGGGTTDAVNQNDHMTTGAGTGQRPLSPAEEQAARNAGVGHAANGLPIGEPGTGTSDTDQR